MLEVHRECLADAFDMTGLVSVLEGVKARKIAVRVVDTKVPSTFAKSLLFSFVGNFLYDGDAPLAERRAQALLVDPDELRALLGEGEMRKLLDPKLSDALEDELQRRTFPLTSADGLHDLLLYVGDLSPREVRARFATLEGSEAAMSELVRDKRAAEVRIAEELRLVAVEDAARYRDGLGVVLPHGIPLVFLERSLDPRTSLLARYARTHAPFSARTVGARYGLSIAAVVEAFEPLVREGRVSQGAFLPEGDGSPEYADREVLKALRRRTLFALRHEVAPVEAAVFARFSLAWHGVAEVIEEPKDGERAGGRGRERARASADPDRLLEAIERLEACPLPLSVLEGDVLPARVPGYRPWDLDALLASGEVRWEGIEALGANDGRIALTLGENADALGRRPSDVPLSELAGKLLALFETRGALFFHDVSRAIGGFPNDLVAALHELVWAGHVTNDTLEPLRSAFAATHTDRRKARPSRPLGRTARRAVLPGTEGRFSMRPRELAATPTERRTALTKRLLERHGVLLREALAYEGVAGGFSALYDVLAALEDRGMCRRGYFVEGRGTTQFALPGADDRLRAARESAGDALHWVSAVDPAFAYGAALPFPETRPTAHPTRSAGAHAALVDGVLAAWLSRGGDGLVTFPGAHGGDARLAADLAARALVRVLAALSSGGMRAFSFRTIDGLEATSHPERTTFEQHGFQRRGDALVLAHDGRGRPEGLEVRP
jgi:ATP-dependent Lhr-like helicase